MGAKSLRHACVLVAEEGLKDFSAALRRNAARQLSEPLEFWEDIREDECSCLDLGLDSRAFNL